MTAAALALAQLHRIVDALDARDQQRRGFLPHVPIPDDAELRRIAEVAIAMLSKEAMK